MTEKFTLSLETRAALVWHELSRLNGQPGFQAYLESKDTPEHFSLPAVSLLLEGMRLMVLWAYDHPESFGYWEQVIKDFQTQGAQND